MDSDLIECGLCLYKHLLHVYALRARQGHLPLGCLFDANIQRHDQIACFWIALKCCSIRTAVPNRALMSKATKADPNVLGERELGALIAMDWEAIAVLRMHGLLD